MDIKAQTPAKSVSATGVWDDARSFRIGCECHDPDHDVDMWIEVDNDPEVQHINVGFYVEGTSPHWDQGWDRVRAAWQILTQGFHRSEHHLILDQQGAANFADALTNGVNALSKTKTKSKYK
jgi:hypothetical protein